MSEPFLAEVRIVGFDFAPRGWALCDGQILPINQNQSLYSLLGTTYGGDGRTTFALPDLRGRTPVHVGSGINLGSRGGEETHTLSANEMPQHKHTFGVLADNGTTIDPRNNTLAASSDLPYQPADSIQSMGNAIVNTGGSQGHQNMQPFLVVNFVIALQGLFPSRN